LTIIGGFLGAGKSTWLRHHLHEGRFGRVYLLVNEAAQTPVDHLLLSRADHLELLTGGCACCQGRAALTEALRRLCQTYDASNQSAFERILLETSGLADPANIAALCAQDPLLARRLVIENVIVLVDALHAVAQLEDDMLTRHQVQAASHLIITKAGAVPTDTLARLLATLRRLNPTADIEAAEYGVPSPLPSTIGAMPYDLPTSPLSDAPITPCRLDVSEQGNWADLSVWLSALLAAHGQDIVRVKGVVTTPAGRLLLQSVRQIVQPPEILPEVDAARDVMVPEDNQLVLIGRGMDEARLQRSWRKFVLSEG